MSFDLTDWVIDVLKTPTERDLQTRVGPSGLGTVQGARQVTTGWVERVAREIDPIAWEYYDSGMLPFDSPGAKALVRRSTETAIRILEMLGLGG